MVHYRLAGWILKGRKLIKTSRNSTGTRGKESMESRKDENLEPRTIFEIERFDVRVAARRSIEITRKVRKTTGAQLIT